MLILILLRPAGTSCPEQTLTLLFSLEIPRIVVLVKTGQAKRCVYLSASFQSYVADIEMSAI